MPRPGSVPLCALTRETPNDPRHHPSRRLHQRHAPARYRNRSISVLTDPPYLCNYRNRDGQTIRNDRTGEWLYPAFRHIHRMLKPNSFCVSFYGWHKVDEFMAAWRSAGFRPAGHIVFRKRYASSVALPERDARAGVSAGEGRSGLPAQPIAGRAGVAIHRQQAAPDAEAGRQLETADRGVLPRGRLVLDPFCGSGSTLVAARETGRPFTGIELDRRHWATAVRRLKTIRRSGDFSEVREAA